VGKSTAPRASFSAPAPLPLAAAALMGNGLLADAIKLSDASEVF